MSLVKSIQTHWRCCSKRDLDMVERDRVGEREHGTHPQAFNGRDALWDAYCESMDLTVYLRQVIFERDGK